MEAIIRRVGAEEDDDPTVLLWVGPVSSTAMVEGERHSIAPGG